MTNENEIADLGSLTVKTAKEIADKALLDALRKERADQDDFWTFYQPDPLMVKAADRIEELLAWHGTEQSMHAAWRKRAEEAEAALAAVRAEERKAAWQPIETAPKDGTEVLLVWHWDSSIHRGVSVVMTSWYCRTHVHLSRAKDCPNEPDCKEGWGAYAGRMSHWMPKPDPPAIEATENRKGEG